MDGEQSDILQLLVLYNYVTTQKREILFNVLSERKTSSSARELISASHCSLFLEIQVSWHSAIGCARESYLQSWNCVLLHVETLLHVLSYFLLKPKMSLAG